jgi:hypothetical protein
MKKTNMIMIALMVISLTNSCQYSDTSQSTHKESRKDSLVNQNQTKDNETFKSISENHISFEYTVDNWLKIGLSESSVRDKLGKPDSIGNAILWDAIGLEVYSIFYFEQGIKLEMEDDGQGNTHIMSILISPPSTSKITPGIGIGTSRQELIKAHRDRIDQENSTKNSILVGSLYDGVLFTLESDRITNIFIGSLAE